ncbi:hypothetical protein T265_01957 [Opisthorchis viverrini]|uniref:tRNA-dihydrouridine(47) synthase [NAD(P)(+)] n=1 Tax=Opisthorchis viverrini TaxID=6198 RepID=A0A074ZWN2_OPIVI|nr:hypothetical protein T265_01957 [Opisthorchis viverrini]KER31868.1 hypothetical protein T265_01957 [Opisthorchis viverrini]
MDFDLNAGYASIKREFIKNVTTPPPKVPSNPSEGDVPVKRRRKQEKLATKSFGPMKLCPYVVTPFPEPCSNQNNSTLVSRTCPFLEKGCRYSHDVGAALASKRPDISGSCPVLASLGRCVAGPFCRWASSHSMLNVSAVVTNEVTESYNNSLTPEVRTLLYKRQYDFNRADAITRKHSSANKPHDNHSGAVPNGEPADSSELVPKIGMITDEDLIKPRPREKKQIDFVNKLYLAPLTTVGNLPFRRICKRFGAEITCGEMALATQLLQGRQSEWALLRRHESEELFGVQLCGGHTDTMTRAAQLIDEQCEVDFIDVNCGCPIDMIWRKGAGSGLLQHGSRLESIVRGMDSVLTTAQVTVKLRSGVREGKNTAHQLIPGLRQAGVSLITIHGRSREQRYTKLADWDYVRQCAEIARPIPVFGNGDILSLEDYMTHKECSGVSGVMIARGALIKPWLFTEIRDCRTWDISASERLDILRDFSNYGLELWGSDTRGVETTRRFMLEWLSFLYRYIPYGILERVPQRINERPPAYFGRNDLETLMASENCADWIRISEMLLGPVPDGFTFTPKHKANAYR